MTHLAVGWQSFTHRYPLFTGSRLCLYGGVVKPGIVWWVLFTVTNLMRIDSWRGACFGSWFEDTQSIMGGKVYRQEHRMAGSIATPS